MWRVARVVSLSLSLVLLGARPVAAAETGGATGLASPSPWSGWWWPAWGGVGPTLFAVDGPLARYDQYVANSSGADPGTRDWERQQVYLPGNRWAGHCNGFAAAALLEPEPTEPITVLGVTFSVADQKGLLVDYHFGDTTAWSFGQDGSLDPADLHRMLLEWTGRRGKGFVVTFDRGDGEVWSYPLARFESQWTVDDTDRTLWHVGTTVWLVDMNVAPDFVGTREYPAGDGLTFSYTLRGDPRRPTDGAWDGDTTGGLSGQPSRIWYPQPRVRNQVRDLVSPGLDRQTIANILAGSDGAAAAQVDPTP